MILQGLAKKLESDTLGGPLSRRQGGIKKETKCMASTLTDFIQCQRRLAAFEALAHIGDAQLLERYVTNHDEIAFEVLLYRYGGMVLSLCRRLVRNPADVEDAFQATWITLARKAVGIRRPEAVASWLYKVAFRAAGQVKATPEELSGCNGRLDDLPDKVPQSDPLGPDGRLALDEEIARLPAKYRAAIVLCYLEGKSILEASRQLSCPRGTVLSRLARARDRLRIRLKSRGFAISSGNMTPILAMQSAPAVVPAALANVATQAAIPITSMREAAAIVSPKAASLAEGVCRVMTLTRMKMTVALVLGLGVLGGGAGLVGHAALSATSFLPPQVAASEPLAGNPVGAEGDAPVTFDNDPGWRWVLPPQTRDATRWSHAGIVCLFDEPKDGAFLVYLAYSGKFDPRHPQYRPVIFDAKGMRYLPEPARGGSSNHMGSRVSMVCYRLDPKVLTTEKVARIGIEAPNP
jgi:RNA polymerase sigma factor (sigma-70 family)